MDSVNLNIRTDKEVKAQAEKLFDSLGLNMTTAINIFLRKAITENGIPFEVKLSYPNRETVAAIEAAERGEDLYGPFDSVSALMEALDA